MRVLVVDDDPLAIEIYWRDLPPDRFEIITAANGHEALEVLQTEHVDLLACDVVMPCLDGLSLVTRVRSMPNLQNIPVLMASAYTADPTRIACLKAGADEFITKPVRTSSLPPLIELLVMRRHGAAEGAI
ncbi:response regulator [Methyloceanibacter sp.]|uniref:response regulator n=1 Tax=Methyloceanibacter sp. TaxID=1965321 RepID=UPI003C795B7B